MDTSCSVFVGIYIHDGGRVVLQVVGLLGGTPPESPGSPTSPTSPACVIPGTKVLLGHGVKQVQPEF